MAIFNHMQPVCFRVGLIELPTPSRWLGLVETLLVLLPVTYYKGFFNENDSHSEPTPPQNRG